MFGVGRVPFYNYTTANISFTIFAVAPTASEAASMLNSSVTALIHTLNNMSGVVILGYSAQPTFFPIYNTTGGELSVGGYGASIDFSLSVPAADVPSVLDALRNTTNTRVGSITITPDRTSMLKAEQEAFSLALQDAANRAENILAPLNLCVQNVSNVVILNPLVGGGRQNMNSGVPFLNQYPFLMNEGSNDLGGLAALQGMSLPQVIGSDNEIAVYLLVTFLTGPCRVM